MKRRARTLIILGAVLVLCVGAYIGVSIYTANETQKSLDDETPASLYVVGSDAPVKISYGSGDKLLSFTFENDKWLVDDNKEFPLAQAALTNIATTLSSLSAVRTIDMPSSLATYGLDQPRYTLWAADAAGNAMKLLVGAQIGSNYYAMLDGENKVYTILPALIGYLNTDLLSMITLDVLPVLSETTMKTITLASGPLSLTLDKHTNKDGSFTWFIGDGTILTSADEFVLPIGAERSPEKYISNAVSALSAAKFTSCAAFKPIDEEQSTFGLDASTVVTVNYTDAATNLDGTAVIEIGGTLSDGGGYYARLLDSQQINILSIDAIEPLIDAINAMGTAG